MPERTNLFTEDMQRILSVVNPSGRPDMRQILASVKSPDGRYEVIRRHYHEIRMGSPLFGELKISGSRLRTVPGRFAEPVAFSPDSRFLAAVELTNTAPGPEGRVIVFDLRRGVRHNACSFKGLARSFAWETGNLLNATTWSHDDGEQSSEVWSPPPEKSSNQSRKKRRRH